MVDVRLVCAALLLPACAPGAEPRFALREPVRRDADLQPVSIPCRERPRAHDSRHVSCAPERTDLPEIWDGVDHVIFRPMSEALGVTVSGEAENVNSLDEVPDSAWFTNRPAVTTSDLRFGACDPSQILDPDGSMDGTWIIDRGKEDGAASGFRVRVPGKGEYMFKADPPSQPELQTAAGVVGAAIYHAAGFNTACEQVVYFKPSLLRLTPGLRYRHDTVEDLMDFDQRALDRVLASCPRRGGLVRMSAAAWIPGYVLGPFYYDGTRRDDPSDVIPHEDRRDLRGLRLVAAWTDNVDSRDANTLDSWLTDAGNGAAPDASPGHVVHYCMDFSHTMGPDFGDRPRTERLGYSYIYDWDDMAEDFFGLGIPRRPWFRPLGDPGFELFRSFDVHSFVPDQWKMQWSNPAYSRMTERDGAWMARILARFTPDDIRAFAAMARFTDPRNTEHLAEVLEGRLARVLDRYLTRLSPIGELRVEGGDRLCGVDLAERRSVREASTFRYVARGSWGGAPPVQERGGGAICVGLPHVAADGGSADDPPERYVRVRIEDGVAQGPLLAYLYDRGPLRGYLLAGLERPER